MNISKQNFGWGVVLLRSNTSKILGELFTHVQYTRSVMGRQKGSWFLTGCNDPQTTQINKRKKCNNIPRSKIMMPHTFVQVCKMKLDRQQVCKMKLDRQHAINWQTVIGCPDPSQTVTSWTTRYRPGILDKPQAFVQKALHLHMWKYF